MLHFIDLFCFALFFSFDLTQNLCDLIKLYWGQRTYFNNFSIFKHIKTYLNPKVQCTYSGKYSAVVGKCLVGVWKVSELKLFCQCSVSMLILVDTILCWYPLLMTNCSSVSLPSSEFHQFLLQLPNTS